MDNETLELSDGLNILQAPNETGKSTWCAFLAAMLYGINSRERDRAGFIAEKNRYAPWSGAAMGGRMDCRAEGRELTLLRETRRQNAPMGEFKAVYTGTGDTVPDLTGASCGESLLGIPREVFERSAFIRQAGLSVTANRELERRIAASMTSGEEGTSYTEAVDALKKQLNRRQHNKTGLIPAAQAELNEVRRRLSDLQNQQETLASTRRETETLNAELRETENQLAQWQAYRAGTRRREWADAQAAAEAAEKQAARLRLELETDHSPETEVIARLRGAVVNLETARKAAAKARREQEESSKALEAAQAALNDSPFAGQTPEQAASAPLDAKPKPKFPLWAALLAILAGTGLGCAVWYATQNLPLAFGGGCGLAGLSMMAIGLLTGRRQNAWEASTLALRRERSAQVEAYTRLYKNAAEAKAANAAKAATADALSASLRSNEEGILREVRRFAPAVADIHSADQALREAAVRRKALASAEAEASAARMRWELLAPSETEAPAADAPDQPPVRSQTELSEAADKLRQRLAALRSRTDQLSGQIAAVGDPAVLSARAEELTERIAALTGEYDAIALALEALDSANTNIQSRFSPALGRRAAEIFGELTDHRYSGVVLDRTFRLSAEPAGDTVYRDAMLLSAGALDQLYLAVRLAICELVLPPEKAVPIILDDALANFDDARCAAALRWLRRAADQRQILLFTCHSREAAFFAEDSGVNVRTLGAANSYASG